MAGNEQNNNNNNQEDIKEYGDAIIGKQDDVKIHLMTIIGEIEGHEAVNNNTKSTKYEHILPKLAQIEDDQDTDGVLLLLNTMGGDVSAGLALAEMVASLSKPTVSLVLGDSHSIAVPLAVSTDYSYIVPTGTMVIHPVRMSGTIIGARQTFEYFQMIQDRIVGFIASHSKVSEKRVEEMMMYTEIMTKDLGTVLVGKQAVEEGLINEVGGIKEAVNKVKELCKNERGKH